MIVRQCDRCGAEALDPQVFEVQKSIVVPQSDPATNTPAADFGSNVSIAIEKDVCAICCASVITEYASSLLGAKVLAAPLKALATAADTAQKVQAKP